MVDRTLVRQGPLVTLATAAALVCAAALVAGAGTRAQDAPAKPKAAAEANPKAAAESPPPAKADGSDKKTAAPDKDKEKGKEKDKAAPDAGPIESRPYTIRVWVDVDPLARLDGAGRDQLVAAWRALVRRMVGPPWQIEVAPDARPVMGIALDDLRPQTIAPLVADADKGWVIRVASADDGFVFSGREFDRAAQRLGQTYRREAPNPADAARALFQLTLDMFSPVASVGESSGGGVTLTVQGAALPAADPAGQIVKKGTVFRPFRVFYTLKGAIEKFKDGTPMIKDIPHSFLLVKKVDGANATCDIVSGLRNPLTKRTLRAKYVALGIKPAAIPTRFQFVAPEEKRDPSEKVSAPIVAKPAAGFTLTARAVPDGAVREIATTDRDGRVVLPPGFADRLVVLRLLAGNIEPLREFPAMPGESLDEQIIQIQPKPEAVAFETRLNSVRDEVIDLVGQRRRMENRIKARIDGEKPDEAKELIKEYKKMPAHKVYKDQLDKFREEAIKEHARIKVRPVYTGTLQKELAEVTDLVDRYLGEEAINKLEDALEEYVLNKNAAEKAKAAGAAPTAAAPRRRRATADSPAPADAAAEKSAPAP